MGRPFLVEFDTANPMVRFLVCRLCRAHLALYRDFICFVVGDNDQPIQEAIFREVKNVTLGEITRTEYAVAQVYCAQCYNHVGTKIADVPASLDPDWPAKDCFNMWGERCLLWNGTEIVELLPPHLNPNLVANPNPNPVANPDPEPNTDPNEDPDADPNEDPEPNVDPVPIPDLDPNPNPLPAPVPDPDPNPDPEVNPYPDPNPNA